MNVKDVVKYSATFLGRESVIKYLNGENTDADDNVLATVDTFTRCVNLVVNELAASYLPMTKKRIFKTDNGRIYYKDFSETVLEIIGVYDDCENEIPFTQSAEYVETVYSEYAVEYAYLPPNYGLTDEIGYKENVVSARIIAYGVAAEFCITERAFDESVMWRKRFTDALSKIIPLKNKRLRARRFI